MNIELNELHAFFAPVEEFLSGIEPLFYWEDVLALANTAFATSLVGALAGAFAGAYMAQRIAERGKLREALVPELRSVNAAIALASEIVNTLLALKAQHVASINSAYLAECTRYKEYMAKRATGQIQGNMPFPLQVDFRYTPTLSTPVEMLRDLVLGKISATGRPLHLAASLPEALRNLNASIARRNEFIEHFKGRHFPAGTDPVALYLGLASADGRASQGYGDTLSEISSFADDALFFGELLCRDLRDYGQGLAERLGKLLKATPPRVHAVDFSKAKADNLIPKDEDYASWLTAFEPPAKAKRRWWKRGA
jgi:hypothetical protein